MRFFLFSFVFYVQVLSILTLVLIPCYFFIWILTLALKYKMVSHEYLIYPIPVGAVLGSVFGISLYLRHTKNRKKDHNRFNRTFLEKFSCRGVLKNWMSIKNDLKELGYEEVSTEMNGDMLVVKCIRPRSPVHPWKKNSFLSERSILIEIVPQGDEDLVKVTIKPSRWYQYGDFTESSYFLLRNLKSYFEKKYSTG